MLDQDAFKFSGEAAQNYDRYLGPSMFEPAARELVSLLHPEGQVTDVLEIASGTGRVTRHLLEKFPAPTSLTATDINSDMLEVAKTKLENTAVRFMVADAQNLPFPDNSFDLVVCQFGIMFFPDRQQALGEAFRVLRPGGKFYFSTWDKTENMEMHRIFFEEGILPLFEAQERATLTVPFSLSNPTQLDEWMQQAGFTHTKAKLVRFPGQAESADVLVQGFFVKHTLGREVQKKNPEAFESLPEHFEKELISKFGKGPIQYELGAVFVSGQKPA